MKNVATQRATPCDRAGSPWTGRALPALCLIIALGAALRLAFLGRKSFWLDEILSVSIARLDGAGFRNIVFSWEANMSLYYLMLRGWMRLARGEFGIRLLSVLPAVAAIPVLYAAGRRLFGASTALIAALLLAVHAFAIRYAQEARGYSFYLLFTLLAGWLFLRAVDSECRRDWVVLALVLAAGIYCHFFAALMLPVLWAGAALHPRRAALARPMLIASAAVAAAALPLGFFVLLKDKGQLNWVAKTSGLEFYQLALLLSGRGGRTLLLVSLACLLAAALTAIRACRSDLRRAWAHCFAWLWLLLPIAVTCLLSLRKPLFVPRFLRLCLPPFLLLVAAWLRAVRPRWLLWPALLAVAALSLAGTRHYYRTGFDPPEQDWRGLVRNMLAESRPGDAAIFYHPLARLPFEYYREQFPQSAVPRVLFPPRADARLLKGTPLDASFLPPLPAQFPRVWLVQNYGPDEFSGELHRYLGAHYRLRQERIYGVIHVFLYSR